MIAFTPTSDRASCATGSDTPTGRHTTSGAGSSGAHEIIARINPTGASRVTYRDALAKWWAPRGRSPLSGRHATKCPYAESAGHTGECVFDTRMHGAVLVRPTGERVAA